MPIGPMLRSPLSRDRVTRDQHYLSQPMHTEGERVKHTPTSEKTSVVAPNCTKLCFVSEFELFQLGHQPLDHWILQISLAGMTPD